MMVVSSDRNYAVEHGRSYRIGKYLNDENVFITFDLPEYF